MASLSAYRIISRAKNEPEVYFAKTFDEVTAPLDLSQLKRCLYNRYVSRSWLDTNPKVEQQMPHATVCIPRSARADLSFHGCELRSKDEVPLLV